MDQQPATEAVTHLKNEIEKLVKDFNIQELAKNVEDYGKKNPVGLALTSLSIGIAAGLLFRNTSKNLTHSH